MLKQYDFSFPLPDPALVRSEFAVKLHGALMHSISGEDAGRLHERKMHPFSLYCIPGEGGQTVLARISTLGREGEPLLRAAQEMRTFFIPGVGKLPVTPGSTMETELTDIAAQLRGERFRLMFLTPSCFKSGGRETGLPDITMHFHSVLRRMEAFEGEHIETDDFRRAFCRCRFGDWTLEQVRYNISGLMLSGMTGYADVTLPGGAESELLQRVFAYAAFSGTGARTGMGMGGFFPALR